MARDVAWGKVSVAGAREDYGVLVTVPQDRPDEPIVDEAASAVLRARMRAERVDPQPFFDRGPGYARLSGGAAYPQVDLL